MKLVKAALVALFALLALVGPAAPSSAAPPQPGVAEEGLVSGNGNNNNKHPSVAAGGGRAYVAWSADEAANLADRPEESGAWNTTRLGSVGENSTYFTAAVDVGGDGSVHLAWIDNGDTIRYRYRAPGQEWGPDRVVTRGVEFANGLSIAVQGNTEVFVAWRFGDGDIGFGRSANSGGDWPNVGAVPLSEPAYAGAPRLAAGNGAAFLTWTAEDGNVYVGQWNGSNFPNDNITSGDNAFFNPTVAVGPNGQPFVAWRGIGSGVYYASRQSNGSWPASNVFRHTDVAGPVAIDVDSQGNIHLGWISNERSDWNAWYSVKTPTEAFSNPIVVSRDDVFKANVDMDVSVKSGYLLAHFAWESFANDGQYIRYSRVRTNLSGATPPPPQPTPTPPPPPAPPSQPIPPTGSFDFANGAFGELWTRTDSLVRQNAVSYSWIWGPGPFTPGVGEYYVQSPGEARLVQYFDKSRMEINQPEAPRGPFYVTNGRLTDELITGQMQVGDAQYQRRAPATLAVAGDPANTFPRYVDLQAVYRKAGTGSHSDQEIYRGPDGSVRTQPLPNAGNDPSMLIVQRVNGLGIPRIFWDFMNRPGQVMSNGSIVDANPLLDWRYVIGEPLTEAYWTYIKVGGVDRGVLVQAFERRVLTYTPTNGAQFQVEMGNIGRHYFEWRYGVAPR